MKLPIDFKIILATIILAVIGAAGWFIYDTIDSRGYDRGHDAVMAQWAASSLKASQKARAREQALQKQLKEAQDAAKKRETELRADADRARTESERVRGDIAAIRARLPSLTEQAVRRYADAASIVFDQCQRRYQGVAEILDRCTSDVQTLMDAWPKE